MFQREANKPPGSPTGLEGYEILVSSAATAPGKLSNGVFRFNAGTGRLEGVLGEGAGIHDPRGLRPAPDESYFVVNNGDDSILKFETATRRFLGVVARLPGLNPGGGKFGSDGRYYVGSRSWKSVVVFDVGSGWKHSTFIPGNIVAFPRGLACAPNGDFYLASGADPASGQGRNTVLRFDGSAQPDPRFAVSDPWLSPLDTEIGPTGNLLVSSEYPFAHADATSTVREYDGRTGSLLRVFDAALESSGRCTPRNPRGITIGPDGALYSASADNVIRYDLATGRFDAVVVRSAGIMVQSVIFVRKPGAN